MGEGTKRAELSCAAFSNGSDSGRYHQAEGKTAEVLVKELEI